MTIPVGSRLGPYEILGLLGAGGMGEVYRSRDTRLGRTVALKVLPLSFAADPDRLRRSEQEARTAGSLNHPGIVTVYDVGLQDGQPFFVTELLEGETLRARLSKGAVPVPRVVEWTAQVARALAAAHGRAIVHRDLKPENLFLTNDGRIKILDFGLAKARPTSQGPEDATASFVPAPNTQTGVVLGTPSYMSPEQVRGQAVDPRSDLFSSAGPRSCRTGVASSSLPAPSGDSDSLTNTVPKKPARSVPGSSGLRRSGR